MIETACTNVKLLEMRRREEMNPKFILTVLLNCIKAEQYFVICSYTIILLYLQLGRKAYIGVPRLVCW